MTDIGVSLQITLLGMGLVFGAIILITLMMSLLVKLTTKKANKQAPPLHDQPEEAQSSVTYERMKRQAAAAAVAYALALEARSTLPHPIRASRPRPISPWQAAQRGQLFTQRGRR